MSVYPTFHPSKDRESSISHMMWFVEWIPSLNEIDVKSTSLLGVYLALLILKSIHYF